MATLTGDRKVSDLTVNDLRRLIKDTIYEFVDSDFGLELKPEVEEALRESLKSKERIPVDKVAEELGLNW